MIKQYFGLNETKCDVLLAFVFKNKSHILFTLWSSLAEWPACCMCCEFIKNTCFEFVSHGKYKSRRMNGLKDGRMKKVRNYSATLLFDYLSILSKQTVSRSDRAFEKRLLFLRIWQQFVFKIGKFVLSYDYLEFSHCMSKKYYSQNILFHRLILPWKWLSRNLQSLLCCPVRSGKSIKNLLHMYLSIVLTCSGQAGR